MRQNNPILSSALIVFGFWWLFFTLREFSMSPLEVIRNWAYIAYSMRLWVIGAFAGLGAGAWYIWFQRAGIEDGLKGVTSGGMVSTLGKVPMPAAAPDRIITDKKRLPLNVPIVAGWLKNAQEEHPEHAALFLAVWDIYSHHRQWPASHRAGGHNDRRLWEHCLAVTVNALTDAPFWKYTGVHLQISGRKPRQIIAPSRADFEFDGTDPLIPLLALAHDIGKLEAYKLNPDGSVRTGESGSTLNHDDIGVHHDALGARILARLPEFWKLPHSDRRILSLVIAHYHHPSSFPVDRSGLSLDDRMTSLLEFLILCDKKTGMQETGLTEEDVANAITEDESTDIYNTFVEIVTEHGRINGIHGNSKADKGFMIGSKHGDLIVVQEKPLRTLMLAKLGLSISAGESRYRLTMHLLRILTEKGLLYVNHNGTDFSRYLPMWQISLRRTKDGGHICDWGPVLIFRPLQTTRELDVLVSLAEKKARMRVEEPRYTHNGNIRDVEALRNLVRLAFDEKVSRSFTIPKYRDVITDEDEEHTPIPAAPVAQAAPAPITVPPAALVAQATPVVPVAPQAIPAPATAAAAPAPVNQPALVAAPIAPLARPEQTDVAAAPWEDEPVAAEVPTGTAEAESDFDPSDVPDVDGAGDLDDVDLPSLDAGDVADAADDLFDDFPSTPPGSLSPPAPASRPEPEIGRSPRDAVVIDRLRQEQAPVGPADIPPDVVGRTIRDADAPRGQDISKGEKAEKAMKALQAASEAPIVLEPPARKKKRPGKEKLTIEGLQQLLASRKLKAAGEQQGYAYVFRADLQAATGNGDAFVEALALGLPTRDAGKGVVFVGIPIAK